MNNKVKSFTLSELLVSMIITVIVVGLSFSVLNLVKKQLAQIQRDYAKTNELTFFKQQIWLDFNKNNLIFYNIKQNQLLLKSDTDSLLYTFETDFIIRKNDTLKSNIEIEKLFFEGNEVKDGIIDAISFTEKTTSTNKHFFVFKKNDATLFMNQDGF